ncbi:hypothetical protein CPC16_001630 [Podila verticillata]|nr:hypothetical protein CPC16_001630 [Podila verticillata]
MFTLPPSSPHTLDSDCLLLPASSIFSTPLDYAFQCSPSTSSPSPRARTHPTARLAKLSNRQQRPSRRVLESTSSAIFGHWDIHIKSEPSTRAHARTSGTTPSATGGGGVGRISTVSNTLTTTSLLPPTTTTSSSSSTTITPAPTIPLKEGVPIAPLSSSSPSTTHNNKKAIPPPASLPSSTTPTTTTTDGNGNSGVHAPFSARATFMRALGKFKNKSKRTNAPSSAMSSTTSPTIPDRTSFVLPPIQFGDADSHTPSEMDPPLKESKETTEEAKEAKEAKETSEPKDTKDAPSHTHTLQTTSLHQDTEMTEPMANLSLEENHSRPNMGQSSLRVKFKNRVSHTLATIKSSSNLRDKAKVQDLATSLASVSSTPTSPTSCTSKISEMSHKSDDQPLGSKNRPKTFWTFPRLDSTKNRPSSAFIESKDDTMDAAKIKDTKEDTQVEPKTDDDSDHSLDFILPVDYEDYTQFAEYPLKKRKKMEAAFAANGTFPSSYSNKRPNSVRASADAMKRFLTVQKQASAHPSKSNVLQADQALATVRESAKDASTTTRPTRSDTIQSMRSRSMATSTHPGLMATTISRARGPGLRRETLEMAMRRRRQSSAARSNISDTDVPPLPRSSEFFGIDSYSTTNITHTFTSFTLELADMYAQDVMSNSATPGLFNFKRRSTRMTISSHLEPDTDQSFRGFDGDAISGYTGDADVSMDEIYVQPRTPTSPRASDSFSFGSKDKGLDLLTRRKLSSVDGDSDTVSELPTLTIRTRDLNRPSPFGSRSGLASPNNNTRVFTPRPVSGSSFEMGEEEQARSPTRRPSSSLARKTGRTTGASSTPHSPKSPSKKQPMSIEEIASWKPRQVAPHPMASNQFQARPLVPALDTRKPAKNSTQGSGVSSSTTLVPSSRTPVSNILQSGGLMMSPAPLDTIDESDSGAYHPPPQHQRGQGSSSSMGFRFQHAKGISGVSTLSASSEYSAQTRFGDVAEFDSHEFPTTPVDMKGMDLEALLAKAEREHQLGWEDLMAQKKTQQQQQQQQEQTKKAFQPLNQQPLSVLKTTTVAPLRSQNLGVNSVAFDLGPSDDAGTGTGTGSDRSSRTKRVMKKKMSVIRLPGHGSVQGKREQDGVIRLSMSSA